MKNLDSLAQFLGISAKHTEHGLILHQATYAEQILNKAGMSNSKMVSTPISFKTDKQLDSPAFDNPKIYRQLVGALQYLTLTRPDITYAVNRACQHMHQLTVSNFEFLKRILRYIAGSKQIGIPIGAESLILSSYTDFDWAGDSQDRKSTTGYCNFLGSTPISWCAKKQTTVARSSTEAEYIAIALTTTEIIWLRRLLEELDCIQAQPTPLYYDNTSAIALANNPVYHARTKHIEIDCHFIRECIKNQFIQVHHIASKDQIADLFTKPLSISRFKQLITKLTVPIEPLVCRGMLTAKQEWKNNSNE
ncbi:uncharacterized protein LOC110101095 [Dendrobium catenatum]|uniref:uncharacterized protein LOC110101095 n=1 Tax=Dendrobium catenatum TaxID=906689 RepID=UPI0009F71DA9|nr:uncharacterized protein LOC110101095 [Dendrobium catenatum]